MTVVSWEFRRHEDTELKVMIAEREVCQKEIQDDLMKISTKKLMSGFTSLSVGEKVLISLKYIRLNFFWKFQREML